MAYPPAPGAAAMPRTLHSVAGALHGGGGGGGGAGGAGVQHGSLCSAVLLSRATVVVHDGSTVQGGTQATTRQTIRPMHEMCWLHWPYRNWKQPVTQELHPSGPHPHVVPSQPGSQKPHPPPHPVVQPQVAWQSM